MLARLHDTGPERDKAGNRELHMDEYCILQLLWMFSPILTSLRGLQQASELDKVRKKLGVGRASLGSLSESVRIFDPEPLKEIAAELAAQLPQPSQGAFDPIGRTLTAVDGSVVETIVRVARLAWLPKAGGKINCGYRLHTQFEIFRGTVSRGWSETELACLGGVQKCALLFRPGGIPANSRLVMKASGFERTSTGLIWIRESSEEG